MAHIKEPKGVDFIIQSEPLTNEARLEISNFIQAYNAKTSRRTLRAKTSRPKAGTIAKA